MAADLNAAQGDLSTSLIELRGVPNMDAALIGQAESNLAAILALKRQLSTASGSQLSAIRAQIAVAVSSAASTAHQAQQAAASACTGPISMASARQAAHEAVNEFEDAYFKQRKFDPYLHFESDDDEREYRRREAERHQEIEKAQALHTSAGDLRAVELSHDQLVDAGAHGADRSPDFAPLFAKVTAAKHDLQTAIIAQDQQEAAEKRLGAAQTATPAEDAPSIPPEVLAALRAVKSPDADGAGHGLGAKPASADAALTR